MCAETTNYFHIQHTNGCFKCNLSNPRTVFTPQWLALQDNIRERESLSRSLMYYAKKGVLLNPRKGIYTKLKYEEQRKFDLTWLGVGLIIP